MLVNVGEGVKPLEVDIEHFRNATIASAPTKEYKNTAQQKEQNAEGILAPAIIQLLQIEGVPQHKWQETAAEIERVLRKAKTAAVDRPLWDERAKYPELTELSAPQFLKKVWADQFDALGAIESEVVGAKDKSLLKAVNRYVGMRELRSQGPGDAAGLHIIKAIAGRPKRAQLG
ncbi:hypothetical protein JQ554_23300 [Bradyrhizobium diazoefficiens]|nr:hypothetical protein [Bradyrhizobium diazoefficiens]MBR0966980.1 hypothetical protein [Bradyrhizobium diazoefficiens]MBR0979104.1 hypothetical protein [Bradyrhizobium diazoefficiens]MBR1009963.1 hypothetical protein [Bradyrhizobium diazoefficiens]MBR1015732.1 hypothetical protein [Bradyrhizobium diazoefficiens]MBR1053801.1 hypothetical protein [Bradyrhizobium diazoefficiens]